ncbi:unnamed protein product, partial [Prunus brigantina]
LFDTSSFKFRRSKGSIGHAFTVRHLRYLLTDVPPRPNSPPDNVFRRIGRREAGLGSKKRGDAPPPFHGISKITLKVVVFQFRRSSHLYYTSQVISQSRTRVKLNGVFFPRRFCQARSLGRGFAFG